MIELGKDATKIRKSFKKNIRRGAGITGQIYDSEKCGHVELRNKSLNSGNVLDTLANDISDSMDPTKASSVAVRVIEPDYSGIQGRETSELYYEFIYLRVVHRTEKALLIADGRRRKWYPKSIVEFFPGQIVRIYKSAEIASDIRDGEHCK